MERTYKLAVDMLGSETKTHQILKGLEQSLLRNINYKFYLFGKKVPLSKKLTSHKKLREKTEIIDCSNYISMDDKPSEIIKSKKLSSMH